MAALPIRFGASPPGPNATPVTDWRDGLPVLTTPVVTLREPARADAPSLVTALSTDAVARFMSRPPDTVDGFEMFIGWAHRERHAGRAFCYGIIPAGQQHPVGLIQFRQLEPGFTTAEWGFALGQSQWGTGLFMASAPPAVDFAFRDVGVHRLEARAALENGRGNGVLRKLGATLEGVLRQALAVSDKPQDQTLWSLIDADWPPPHLVLGYDRTDPPTVDDQVGDTSAARPGSPGDVRGWRAGLPSLVGSRCTLREVEPGDARHLWQLLADPEVERYNLPTPPSAGAFELFIDWARRQRGSGRYTCFGVIPDGLDRPVGIYQVRRLGSDFHVAEWGFTLGRPYWGTGLFMAGAELLLDFVFGPMGVHRLEARSAVDNLRANGALRKLGATLEGRLRSSFLTGSGYCDDALWAILSSDWQAARARLSARRDSVVRPTGG